ncbi:MAG: putative toxin-antitoxin system toxin component, PIN family [Saprospiraceae bacterium]
MERIVLDTNILLLSISQKSKHHIVFKSLMDGGFVLCATTEILNEYAEIIEKHLGGQTSEAVLETLMALPNIELVHTYFRFRLLKDEDDNKFVDCAVAANAKYLVSEDRDFKILNEINFPKIDVLRLEVFKQKLLLKNL